MAVSSQPDSPTRPIVRVQVPAKINLALAVGPRRDDGYHDLTTLFQAVSLSDGKLIKPEQIRLPDYDAPQPLGAFSLDGGLEQIVGRFEKVVLETLYREHPSSRLLGKRLGVSHTTIANKLRQYGISGEKG